MPKASWSELWALRTATVGSQDHRRWSIGLYARLDLLSRGFYAGAFPRTDRALREQAWTSLWSRWCERAPGMRCDFAGDDDIVRYVNRSLANALRSLMRRRATRARLHAEHAWELELLVHCGGGAPGDGVDSFERDERLAAARRAVGFFTAELRPLLAGRRAGRADELVRLVVERLAMASGEDTFADAVGRAVAPGQQARIVENRLRKRYGRALQDILAVLDCHQSALVAAGHDPSQLRLFALQLFSDRGAPRRRPDTSPR
jgi:hypothetical protein